MVGGYYPLKKGSIFGVHESWLNDGTDDDVRLRRLSALDGMLNHGLGPAAVGPVDSLSLDREYEGPGGPVLDGTSRTRAQRQEDLNGKWFSADPEVNWWQGWTGDPGKIFAEGAVRVLQVSMGIDRHSTVSPDMQVSRLWPVEITWVSGLDRFEIWISWREFGSGTRDGRVTVTIATPDYGAPEYDALAPSYLPLERINPQSSGSEYGMWVIGHERTTIKEDTGSHESVGDVVTVAPLERDGGVLDFPRPYLAGEET